MSSSNDLPPLKSLAKQLLRVDELDLPPDLREALHNIAKEASKEMGKEVAKFLHYNLDDTKHTEEQIKDVIDLYPEALSDIDRFARLPIQNALRFKESMPFIPLLAQQGNLLDIGGENNRGGLLLSNDGLNNRNAIQRLSDCNYTGAGPDRFDGKALQILKRLKVMGLLRKKDIRKYNLLPYSLANSARHKREKRFEFFADWDPDALKKAKSTGVPLIHRTTIHTKFKAEFEMILKASAKHFPDELGLLFQKYDGKTACEAAFSKYGQRETMKIIQRCIPPSDNLPVLHAVHAKISRNQDYYANAFTCYYPDAMYARDASNRSLFQLILASGKKRFDGHAAFFLQVSDEQLAEKDPITKLFPFALAASGDTSDLTAVFQLLRRNPDLIWGTKARRKKPVRSRKRKRGVAR